ncbi:MAG: hypothetical protein EBW81_03740 [Gammaproteobacteria bacterium]|nr:hypothetical protein [Gammaproteobacteria bacterium]
MFWELKCLYPGDNEFTFESYSSLPYEYVVDAYTVSALGNGSSDAGARILDEFREEVRKKAFGKKKQPNQIDGKKIAKSYA